jgi:hypothetical protein
MFQEYIHSSLTALTFVIVLASQPGAGAAGAAQPAVRAGGCVLQLRRCVTSSMTCPIVALQPGAGGAGAVQPAGGAGGGVLLGRGAAAQPRGAAAAVPAGDAALAVGGGRQRRPGAPPGTRSKRFLTAAAAAAAWSSMGSQLQAMAAMFALLSQRLAAEAQHRSDTVSQGSCEAQLQRLSTCQRAPGLVPAMACGISNWLISSCLGIVAIATVKWANPVSHAD